VAGIAGRVEAGHVILYARYDETGLGPFVDYYQRRLFGVTMTRILIIDDDPSLRRALRKTLEHAGYGVIEADSSEGGVTTYREQQPDLVITDVYMPGGDGVEGTIRVLHEFPHARVVVMTGGGWSDTDKVLSGARRLGAAGTLPKPFTSEEVVSTVKRVLGENE
jgi:DNA-binding NtrC family response regulator